MIWHLGNEGKRRSRFCVFALLVQHDFWCPSALQGCGLRLVSRYIIIVRFALLSRPNISPLLLRLYRFSLLFFLFAVLAILAHISSGYPSHHAEEDPAHARMSISALELAAIRENSPPNEEGPKRIDKLERENGSEDLISAQLNVVSSAAEESRALTDLIHAGTSPVPRP